LTLPIRRRGVLLKVLLRRRGDGAGPATSPLSAYLDTGASDTMLDADVARSLGLEPERSVGLSVLGREGVSFHATFGVEVALAAAQGPPRWLPLDVLSGPVFDTGAAVALGRDFLRHVVLTYDGPSKQAKLAW
jgi:hypothetical protein